MTDFKQIEPASYFQPTRTITIQKTAAVSAIQARGGEVIETVMKNGLVETTNTAKPGDFIITNPTGEKYSISGGKFMSRYDPVEGTSGKYAPKINPLQAMRLSEDVAFKTRWGAMNVQKGGVLVHGGPGDWYGIQGAEFRETYSLNYKHDIQQGIAMADQSLIAPTIGLAMSSYALYQKLQPESRTALDLASKGTRTLAQTGIGLNVSGLLLGSSHVAIKSSQTMHMAWISRAAINGNLQTFNQVAGGAAIAIQLGMGAIEFEIARENKDADRASAAVGTTVGGITGGIAGGTAGTKLCGLGGGVLGSFVPGIGTITGAATGATICGIGGTILGSLTGGEIGRRVSRWALRDALDEFFHRDDKPAPRSSEPIFIGRRGDAPSALNVLPPTEQDIFLDFYVPRRGQAAPPTPAIPFKQASPQPAWLH